jgi:death-on-curing protein
MSDPIFLSEQSIIDLHDDLIAEHGGLNGCNTQKVASVAAYPQQKYWYASPIPGVQRLGASYAFAATKFHAFNDGNKRVALASLDLFLLQNGYELVSSPDENIDVITSLAAAEIGEEDIEAWVQENSVPL